MTEEIQPHQGNFPDVNRYRFKPIYWTLRSSFNGVAVTWVFLTIIGLLVGNTAIGVMPTVLTSAILLLAFLWKAREEYRHGVIDRRTYRFGIGILIVIQLLITSVYWYGNQPPALELTFSARDNRIFYFDFVNHSFTARADNPEVYGYLYYFDADGISKKQKIESVLDTEKLPQFIAPDSRREGYALQEEFFYTVDSRIRLYFDCWLGCSNCPDKQRYFIACDDTSWVASISSDIEINFDSLNFAPDDYMNRLAPKESRSHIRVF